jgi:hypothetical protein
MKGFTSSRAIIAGTQRITAHSVANLIMSRPAGSGIWSQTLDATQYGFEAPIVGQSDESTGISLFFVQSEKFADRYYIVCERANGYWYFSGDEKLREHYLGRVQAMRLEQEAEEVVAQPVAEVEAPVAEVVAATPRRSAPPDIHCGSWNGGASIFISDEEMAEIRSRVRAATPPTILAAQDKEDAFLRVWAEVEAIHHRWHRARGAWKVVA